MDLLICKDYKFSSSKENSLISNEIVELAPAVLHTDYISESEDQGEYIPKLTDAPKIKESSLADDLNFIKVPFSYPSTDEQTDINLNNDLTDEEETNSLPILSLLLSMKSK